MKYTQQQLLDKELQGLADRVRKQVVCDLSNQRVASILHTMTSEGRVVREEENHRAYFRIG